MVFILQRCGKRNAVFNVMLRSSLALLCFAYMTRRKLHKVFIAYTLMDGDI